MAHRRRTGLLSFVAVALIVCAQPAQAENPEWSDLLKVFKEMWDIGRVADIDKISDWTKADAERDKKEEAEERAEEAAKAKEEGREPKFQRKKKDKTYKKMANWRALRKKWDGLRTNKRSALNGLAASEDARTIPALVASHKKQLRFVESLQKTHKSRHAKWAKQQHAMELALRGRKPIERGPSKGQIPVTASEQAWLAEKRLLEGLWKESLSEEAIGEDTRKAMGKVAASVTGKEHEKAIGLILKAAGNGDDPDQIEFIRLLGYVAGDKVTNALEKYAASLQPFVILAALEALGRQNAERSIDTLLGRLDDPRWQVRASALKGLAFYQDVRVVEALLERVATEDGVMQRHYFSALNRMVTTEVTGTVGAWTKWWPENKAKVLEAWKAGGRVGPVENDPAPMMVRSEGGGHTSFYGLKTESKHIIFVLDVSGSMGEHSGKDAGGRYRIDVAKEELKKAIRSLTSEESDERGVASFNLVVYAADVRVFKEGKMIPASKKNKEKAFDWIDGLEAIGATNIYDALEQAFLIIGTRRAKKQLEKGADTIFLMTDGEPNRGKIIEPALIRQEILKMNRDRRITINTIGVGDGHAYEFLEKLAAENDGEYVARGKPPKKKEEEEKKKREEEEKKKKDGEEGDEKK